MVLRQVQVFVVAAHIDTYTRARTYRYLTLIVEQRKKCKHWKRNFLKLRFLKIPNTSFTNVTAL